MSDFKTWEQQLLEIYGVDELKRLRQRIEDKIKMGIELTLREDIIAHPEKYNFTPSSNLIPRPIRLLYKALINIATTTERSGTLRGSLTIDNIVVNGDGGYSAAADIPHEHAGPLIRDSVYLLSKKLHPPGHNYPNYFVNFIDLLARVDSVEELEKLLYHPALGTFTQKATTAYNAYAMISQRAKTDSNIWRKFENRWGTIPVKAAIHGEFYTKVYNDYTKTYFENARGVLQYYKDVLQNVEEKIDEKNVAIEARHLKDRERACKEADAEAIKGGLTDQETKNLVEMTRSAFPEVLTVERYSIERLAEDLENFFPNFIVCLFIFLIEEDIDIWTDKMEPTPKQPLPAIRLQQQAYRPQALPLQVLPPWALPQPAYMAHPQQARPPTTGLHGPPSAGPPSASPEPASAKKASSELASEDSAEKGHIA